MKPSPSLLARLVFVLALSVMMLSSVRAADAAKPNIVFIFAISPPAK